MLNEEIVRQIQSGISVQENFGLLYSQNHGLIYKLVQPYSKYESTEDLMQEAYFGLAKAVERYDSSFDVAFTTYASHWIQQAVRKYVEYSGSVIRLPVHLRERIYAYKSYIGKYIHEHGGNPSEGQIRRDLGLSDKQLADIRLYAKDVKSLDAPLAESQDSQCSTLGDLLEDEDAAFEEDVTEKVFLEALASDMWATVEQCLTGKESVVLHSIFEDGSSLESIGQKLGVSKQRVHQLRERAFQKLRTGKARNLLEQYAQTEGLQLFYSSVNDFKRNGSRVERLAVRRIDLEKQLQDEVKRL